MTADDHDGRAWVRTLDEDGTRLAAAVMNLRSGAELVWNALAVGPDDDHVWTDPIYCPVVCEQLNWSWAWVLIDPRDRPWVGMTLAPRPDDQVEGQPVWLASTVDRAIRGWIAEHAGRTDLEVRRDRLLEWPIPGIDTPSVDHRVP